MIFQPFPKLARLSRERVVTEKIDGTNAQVFIEPAKVAFKKTFDDRHKEAA